MDILTVLFPVLVCALIGALWARSGTNFDTDFISRLVLNVGAPCLMLSVLGGIEIDLVAFNQTALACILIASLMSLTGWLIPKACGDDVRTYFPSFVFPNVGNMGLPVCLFAFGDEGLALALAFFMMLSVAHFPVGILAAGGSQAGGGRGLFKMPILYAIALSLLLLWFDVRLPELLQNPIVLIGGMTIPLMLITLGVSLVRLQIKAWRKALFYSVCRVAGGLLAGLLGPSFTEQRHRRTTGTPYSPARYCAQNQPG